MSKTWTPGGVNYPGMGDPETWGSGWSGDPNDPRAPDMRSPTHVEISDEFDALLELAVDGDEKMVDRVWEAVGIDAIPRDKEDGVAMELAKAIRENDAQAFGEAILPYARSYFMEIAEERIEEALEEEAIEGTR